MTWTTIVEYNIPVGHGDDGTARQGTGRRWGGRTYYTRGGHPVYFSDSRDKRDYLYDTHIKLTVTNEVGGPPTLPSLIINRGIACQ